MNENTRPPLASLACVHPTCELFGQTGQDNLTIRKVYGRDDIRYLRCRVCQHEFSERKGTALWNCKVPEAQAIAVAEHLGEGCSFKGTARLVRVGAYGASPVSSVRASRTAVSRRAGSGAGRRQPAS